MRASGEKQPFPERPAAGKNEYFFETHFFNRNAKQRSSGNPGIQVIRGGGTVPPPRADLSCQLPQYPLTMGFNFVVHRVRRQVYFTRPGYRAILNSGLPKNRLVAQRGEYAGQVSWLHAHPALQAVHKSDPEALAILNIDAHGPPRRCGANGRDYSKGRIFFGCCLSSHTFLSEAESFSVAGTQALPAAVRGDCGGAWTNCAAHSRD